MYPDETTALLTLYPRQMKMAGIRSSIGDFVSDTARSLGRRGVMGDVLEHGADAKPGGLYKALRGDVNATTDYLAAQKGVDDIVSTRSQGLIDDAVAGERAALKKKYKGEIEGLQGERSALQEELASKNPLPYAAAGLLGGGALGAGLGGYAGSQIQAKKDEEEAKRRAMMAFGGGLAAGVAAPNFVSSAAKMLGSALPGAGGQQQAPPSRFQAYPGAKYSSIYGVNTADLDAYEKEAFIKKLLGMGKKAPAKFPGSVGAKMTAKAPTSGFGAPNVENPMALTSKDIKRYTGGSAPKGSGREGVERAIGGRVSKTDVKGKKHTQDTSMGGVQDLTAKQPKRVGDIRDANLPALDANVPKVKGKKGKGKKGKTPAPDAQPGAWDQFSEYAKANPLTTTGIAAGVPLAAAGGAGLGYLGGQHEAENRPFLQRMTGSKAPIMDQISGMFG